MTFTPVTPDKPVHVATLFAKPGELPVLIGKEDGLPVVLSSGRARVLRADEPHRLVAADDRGVFDLAGWQDSVRAERHEAQERSKRTAELDRVERQLREELAVDIPRSGRVREIAALEARCRQLAERGIARPLGFNKNPRTYVLAVPEGDFRPEKDVTKVIWVWGPGVLNGVRGVIGWRGDAPVLVERTYTGAKAVTLGLEHRWAHPSAGDGRAWWERQNEAAEREKLPTRAETRAAVLERLTADYAVTPRDAGETYAAADLVAEGWARPTGDGTFVLARELNLNH